MLSLRQRFLEKIAADPSSDCILWTASCMHGYGQIREAGRGSRMLRATHVSWFLKYGSWPTLHVLHSCDNPPCVNPDHLFAGTNHDNVTDSVAKGRHAVAKLDGLARSELLALSDDPNVRLADAARMFGITPGHLSELRAGRPRKPRTRNRYDVGGRLLTVVEIAAEIGCKPSTVYARLKAGTQGEDLLLPKYDMLRY